MAAHGHPANRSDGLAGPAIKFHTITPLMKSSPPTVLTEPPHAVPTDGGSSRGPTDGAPRRSTLRPLGVLTFCLGLFAFGLFCGGFLVFADRVAELSVPGPVEADGIVVLTGGADRVSGAVDLLARGKARRLLISGVHPDTSARQIGRVVDAGPNLFDCCVDLDRRAANTVGNAEETAKWARHNGFGSLIVVTSAYHMPRSLIELGSVLPGVDLVPYPVARPELDLRRWWVRRETVLLLLEEYLKYTAARTRIALDGVSGAHSVLASVAR